MADDDDSPEGSPPATDPAAAISADLPAAAVPTPDERPGPAVPALDASALDASGPDASGPDGLAGGSSVAEVGSDDGLLSSSGDDGLPVASGVDAVVSKLDLLREAGYELSDEGLADARARLGAASATATAQSRVESRERVREILGSV